MWVDSRCRQYLESWITKRRISVSGVKHNRLLWWIESFLVDCYWFHKLTNTTIEYSNIQEVRTNFFYTVLNCWTNLQKFSSWRSNKISPGHSRILPSHYPTLNHNILWITQKYNVIFSTPVFNIVETKLRKFSKYESVFYKRRTQCSPVRARWNHRILDF